MAYRSQFTGIWLSWIVISFGLDGCSKLEQFEWGLNGSDSSVPAAESTPERVYYIGADGLPLYRNPGSSLIRRLARYTKVYRDDLKKGYAHVRVDGTAEEGWVENAKLVWRLPKHATGSEPARSVPQAPVEPSGKELHEDGATRSDGAPVPSAPADGQQAPAVAPSVFDPY